MVSDKTGPPKEYSPALTPLWWDMLRACAQHELPQMPNAQILRNNCSIPRCCLVVPYARTITKVQIIPNAQVMPLEKHFFNPSPVPVGDIIATTPEPNT